MEKLRTKQRGNAAKNLLRETWTNLDSRELRLLLDIRIGSPGQYERGSGSAAPRVDWPVYPRRAEHNTIAKRPEDGGGVEV